MASRKSRSLANPVHQADILRYAPEESFRNAVRDVNHRVVQYVQQAYRSDPRFMTDQVHIDRLTSIMAPMVQAGQMQVADLTNAHLSSLFGVKHPPTPNLSTFARPGVDINSELSRPFWTAVKTAREQGKTFEQALAAGEARLTKMVQTDLQMAKVRQAREVLKAGGIRRYARVTGGSACWLCEIAATQVYFTEDLLPIHPSCNCSVQPIPDGGEAEVRQGFTPEEILAHSDEQVKRMTGLVENEAPLSDYQDLVAVREHGEIGPMLTWKHQNFTSAADLPVPPSREVLEYQAYQALKANHGVTIDLGGNIPDNGFAYAPFKNTELRVPIEDFTHKHIDDFINLHAAELAKPGNHLGMWESNGAYYLDISRVGPPSELTLAKAQGAHQLAAYDLGRNNEITLGTINDATGAYRPIAAPADLYSEYGRQVARADEARSAAGVPDMARKLTASRGLTWDGPTIGKPTRNANQVETLEWHWQSNRFWDGWGDSMRQGAREAQFNGYRGFPKGVGARWDKPTEAELRAEGADIFARIVHSPKLTPVPMFRGIELSPQDYKRFSNLQRGETLSMPLSSFTGGMRAEFQPGSKKEATLFAKGSGLITKKTPKNPKPVLFQVEPGAKAASLPGEMVSVGQFDVVNVKPANTRSPMTITIRQTSMIEDVVAHGNVDEMAARKAKIPEVSIVEPRKASRTAAQTNKDALRTISDEMTSKHEALNLVQLGDIKPAQAQSIQRAVDDVLPKYPEIKLKGLKVGDTYNKSAYAETGRIADATPGRVGRPAQGPRDVPSSWSEIVVNQHALARAKELERDYIRHTELKLFVKGTGDPVYDMVIHELGHALDNAGGRFARQEAENYLLSAYRAKHPHATLSDYGFRSWLTDNMSVYSFRVKRDIGDTIPHILAGAPLNAPEAVAEAFADVFINGDKASPTSKVLHKLLVEAAADAKPIKKGPIKRAIKGTLGKPRRVGKKPDAMAPAMAVHERDVARVAKGSKRTAEAEAIISRAEQNAGEVLAKAQETAAYNASRGKVYGDRFVKPSVRVANPKLAKLPEATSEAATVRAAMSEDRIATNIASYLEDLVKNPEGDSVWRNAQHWYFEKREIARELIKGTKVDLDHALGYIACFSNRTSWVDNITDATNFIRNLPHRPIKDLAEAVAKGKKWAETAVMDANMERAIRVSKAKTRAEIVDAIIGKTDPKSHWYENVPKLSRFFQNLTGNHDFLTIDTWMGYASRLSVPEMRTILNREIAVRNAIIEEENAQKWLAWNTQRQAKIPGTRKLPPKAKALLPEYTDKDRIYGNMVQKAHRLADEETARFEFTGGAEGFNWGPASAKMVDNGYDVIERGYYRAIDTWNAAHPDRLLFPDEHQAIVWAWLRGGGE